MSISHQRHVASTGKVKLLSANAKRGTKTQEPDEADLRRLPFFFILRRGGVLRATMGSEQRFHCLLPIDLTHRWLADRNLDLPQRYRSVEQIAASLLAEVRSLQTSGPYRLGGYCFGGMVAFEISRQLQEQGEDVAQLALIDPFVSKRQMPLSIRLLRKLDYLEQHGGDLREGAPPNRATPHGPRPTARDGLVTFLLSRSRMTSALARRAYAAAGRPIPACFTHRAHQRQLRALARNYKYQTLPCRITIFVPEGRRITRWTRAFWKPLAADGAKVHEVRGAKTHIDLVTEPHVRILAQELGSTPSGCRVGKLVGNPRRRSQSWTWGRTSIR